MNLTFYSRLASVDQTVICEEEDEEEEDTLKHGVTQHTFQFPTLLASALLRSHHQPFLFNKNRFETEKGYDLLTKSTQVTWKTCVCVVLCKTVWFNIALE